MQTSIKIWKGLPSVKLNAELISNAGMRVGQKVLIRSEPGRIIAESVKLEYKIEDLVAGINDANRHNSSDFLQPAGREIW